MKTQRRLSLLLVVCLVAWSFFGADSTALAGAQDGYPVWGGDGRVTCGATTTTAVLGVGYYRVTAGADLHLKIGGTGVAVTATNYFLAAGESDNIRANVPNGNVLGCVRNGGSDAFLYYSLRLP